MRVDFRSKLILALTSLFIVPFLIVIVAIILIKFDTIKAPIFQHIDFSSIEITVDGKQSSDFIYVILTLFAVFLISLAGMVFILSKLLSDFVLTPLKELNYAAERIGSGDLNFKIRYHGENEFGKLCEEFDTMKDKLMISTRKQEIYENSRKELIASITHDLKTPLTSIIGYVEGLQDGVVTNSETVKDYLNVIHDKSMRLDHLIDDLFTFTQLELEKFTINITPTSMSSFLTEYTDTKLLEFSSKENKFEFIVEKPILDSILNIDEFRIGQVLENLITNAVKFTNSYIKIYTKETNHSYDIFVEDDGIGISKENLPHIFEYFYQCDKARETKRKGTGLGLAICKQLVISHDGKIYVSSEINKGTIFKISLPK